MNVTDVSMNKTAAAYPKLPESWNELFKLDQPIDFQAFLKSDLLAERRKYAKIIPIINFKIDGIYSSIANTLALFTQLN